LVGAAEIGTWQTTVIVRVGQNRPWSPFFLAELTFAAGLIVPLCVIGIDRIGASWQNVDSRIAI